MEDVKPLMDVRNVRRSEPEADSVCSTVGEVDRGLSPCAFADHPIHPIEAADRCARYVGVVPASAFQKWRREWWDLLRAVNKPEYLRSCEVMIDAIGYAMGLTNPEKGKSLADENLARVREEAKRAAEASIQERLDRWRLWADGR